MFELFPDFQMYDYSEHFARMMRFLAGGLPGNYHLTFSRSEDNEAECREVIGWAHTTLVMRSRAEAQRVTARLEAELEAHRTCEGRIVLPR